MTGVLRMHLAGPIIILALVSAGLTGYLGYTEGLDRPSFTGSAHDHLFFRVTVLGDPVDFSQQRFQLRSDHVHFENRDGEILHIHADNVDIGYTLDSLGFGLSTNCLTFGTDAYCSNSTHVLEVWVNGDRLGEDAPRYDLRQGDNVLIRYAHQNSTVDEGFMKKILPRAYRPDIPGQLL